MSKGLAEKGVFIYKRGSVVGENDGQAKLSLSLESFILSLKGLKTQGFPDN